MTAIAGRFSEFLGVQRTLYMLYLMCFLCDVLAADRFPSQMFNPASEVEGGRKPEKSA